VESLLIDGPVGQLQCAYHDVGSQDILLICHPHPQFQGTMNNKVVTTTGKTYMDMGIDVMRFNYRGVGESGGEYGDVSGEVEDGVAVAQWLIQNKRPKRLFLAGFSFGAYIAAAIVVELSKVSPSVTVPHLLLIAPSVENFPFEKVTPFTLPTTVILGEQDEVVEFDAVSDWVDAQYPPVEFISMSEATHFFHGQLVLLKQELKASLSPHL